MTPVRPIGAALLACMLALAGGGPALAQGGAWKPSQPVELIVPSGAGGANDAAGRTIQSILQNRKIVEVPINVVNKPGGAHTIGLNYLNQRAAGGHALMVESVDILTNQIMGKSAVAYTDITPLAQLYSDYIAFSVAADWLMDERPPAERQRAGSGQPVPA